MALKLKGSTSGFVAIDAPSVAGNNTLILPENTGSAQQLLGNDNAGNGGILQVMVRFQTTMRTAPTMTQSGTFSHHVSGINVADTTIAFNQAYIDGIKITGTQTTFVHTDGFCGELISKYSDSSTASIKADAEL